MRKRKSTRKSLSSFSINRTRISRIRINTSPISRDLLRRRTFQLNQPAIYVRKPKTIHIPPSLAPGRKDKKALVYQGFQTENRVTKCDQMRERRRRAYFGYINAPHAGKGAQVKRMSPRGDRFTVKC